jgi:hypothetical protein
MINKTTVHSTHVTFLLESHQLINHSNTIENFNQQKMFILLICLHVFQSLLLLRQLQLTPRQIGVSFPAYLQCGWIQRETWRYPTRGQQSRHWPFFCRYFAGPSWPARSLQWWDGDEGTFVYYTRKHLRALHPKTPPGPHPKARCCNLVLAWGRFHLERRFHQ